jgi:hypothetical protein
MHEWLRLYLLGFYAVALCVLVACSRLRRGSPLDLPPTGGHLRCGREQIGAMKGLLTKGR